MQALKFLKNKFWFFLAFVFNKGVVFIAPLFIAEIISKEAFGVLEYALAGLGMVLNTFLSLGVQSAYPYFKLRVKATHLTNAFQLHYVWLLVFFIITQIAYYSLGFSIQYYMALNVAYVVSNQVYISTQLKTNERITLAVFFDSGIYISLLFFGILAYFNWLSATIETFNNIVLVYALAYVLHAIINLIKLDKKAVLQNYITLLKYSLPVLIGGLLVYFLTVSGRILIEYFLQDFELVGVYAFYFRLSAIVVMIFQVINIAFFKKMYEFEPKILDQYFSLCFVVLYVISLGAFLVTPYFVPYFSEFYKTTFVAYKGVYFLLSCQMVFWIATALLSNIIDREKLAPRNNSAFLILLVLFIISLIVLKPYLSLEWFTLIHVIVITLASLIQIFTLSKKNILFKKSFVALVAINGISLIVFNFIN